MSNHSEYMKHVGVVYNEAFDHVFENLPEERSPKVAAFWLNLVGSRKSYLMVTENGIRELTSEVFKDAVLTDFVITFTSTFFLYWAATEEEKQRLIDVLSSSLSTDIGGMTKFKADYRSIPKQALNHLAGPLDVNQVLVANSWIMVLAMASMFMTHKELMPEAPTKKTKTMSMEVG